MNDALHNGPDRAERAWLPAVAAGGLLLLLLLIYAPALQGAFLWDDPAHVTRAGLRGWQGLLRIWLEPGATQEYYPVLHTAFWLEYILWGESVLPYHLLNVMLHAANALLLIALLQRLDRCGAGRRLPAGMAWIAGVLFAVHPVCVESVAWITEQKNTLSTFFYLLAARLYLEFALNRGLRWYAWASGAFLLALGAKTATVVLPPGLLVLFWWWRGLQWRRDVVPLLPWFLAAVAAGLFTVWFEGHWVGAEHAVAPLALSLRLLLAARILWFYLGQLVWPSSLTFFYPAWDPAQEAAGWWPHLLAAIVVTVVLWLVRTRWKGPLALWLLFAGALFPVMGFFKVFAFAFSYVADHFQYLAVPVFATAAAWTLTGLGAVVVRERLDRARGLLAMSVAGVLAVLAHRQSGLYVDDETLFRANITANPGSWMGHHILATRAARNPERRAEAIALFRRAIALKPDNADSLAALGALLSDSPSGHAEALACFAEAVRLRPGFAEAHNGLANELARDPAHLPEAVGHYRTALALRPRFALAKANLAQALARLPGQEEEALRLFAEVFAVMPDYVPAHYHAAVLLASLPGHEAEAAAHYETVLRLRPDAIEARLDLARLLLRQQRVAEAAAQYQLAIRQAPDQVMVRFETALRLSAFPVYAALVEEQLQAVLRLEPRHLEALNLLGVLRARAGRAEEARAAWRRALEFAPDFAPAAENLRLLDGR
jgi:tetratricopeptide (TPR) repeat protein